MAKKMRRVLSAILVLAICAGQLALPAAAEEEPAVIVDMGITFAPKGPDLPAGTTETDSGTTEKTEETSSSSTEDHGITTTTTTTEENWTMTGGDGTTVTGSETTTHTSEVDDQGNPLTESTAVSGSETQTSTSTTTEQSTVPGGTSSDTQYGDYLTTSGEEGSASSPVQTRNDTTTDEIRFPSPDGAVLEMSQNDPSVEVKEDGTVKIAGENGLSDITETTTETTGSKTSEAGETTVTKEPITDSKGNIIGYNIITTNVKITEEYGDPVTTEGNPVTGDPVITGSNTSTDTKVEYRMPEEPQGGTTVDENGNTVTTTVEPIAENGETVGYKTTTVTTDPDGNELDRGSESLYRSIVTTTTTTEKITTEITTTDLTDNRTVTTTTTTTTDEESRMLEMETDATGFWGWSYRGSLEPVTQNGIHGAMSISGLQPNMDLIPGSYNGYVSSSTLLRNPTNDSSSNGIADGFSFEYVGYGLETAIRVDLNYTTGLGSVLAHQFKLVDKNGNAHYVLCADLGTTAIRLTDYNMINVDSANYYVRDGAAEKIEAIALSGYWGTDSGLGSLEDVKQFMRDTKAANPEEYSWLSDEYIDNMTPGEALTATQAAIWYYGNSDESNAMHSEAITGQVYQSDGSYRSATSEEASTVNALYQMLINIDPSSVENSTTDFIDESNFAQTVTLNVRERVIDSNGNAVIDSDSQTEKYLTDLTFSLDVSKSDLTGNLKVVVTDQYGKELKTVQLATDDSNFVGELLAENSDGSGTYTIRDLEVAEGVSINLNLSGTQNLSEGVYLYSAPVYSTSQTFVGIGSGQRDVDLNVAMKFEVDDPNGIIQNTSSSSYVTQTDTRNEQRQGRRTEVERSTDVTVTTLVVEERELAWDSFLQLAYEYEPAPQSDDDPTDPTDPDPTDPEESETPTTPTAPAERGQKANAPKTGDISSLWASLSLLSMAGMVLLTWKKEEA